MRLSSTEYQVMEIFDYLIIGAGISGLLSASELQRSGASVCVLDKGRGYGGRMATRRFQGARIDHGAQFFTARSDSFKRYVNEWLEAGVICEWYHYAPGDVSSVGHPRYRGLQGMTDVPKYLADSLNVQRSERVISAHREANQWGVESESGRRYYGRHLIVTAPLPQAIQLLNTSGLNWAGKAIHALEAVHYEKGLATLAVLERPSGLSQPGGFKVDVAPLEWIADNQLKGISPDACGVTLHANAEFAETHWDSADAVRGKLMLEAAKPFLKSAVLDFQCHRWGFTRPVNPYPESFFENRELRLSLAGDAFGGPRVEGAALSGIELARHLLEDRD